MICILTFAWLVTKQLLTRVFLLQDFRCVPRQPEWPFSSTMDSRSPNDSDGGRERQGHSPGSQHDEGRPHQWPPQTLDDPQHLGLLNRQPVLSLDQIRITGSCNEYTEAPTVAQRSPASQQKQQKDDQVLSHSSRTGQQESREEEPNNLRNLHLLTQPENASTETPYMEEDTQTIRTSIESSSSSQRLIINNEQIISSQPKRSEVIPEELKPLNSESAEVMITAGSAGFKHVDEHSNKCEDCGRCQCSECTHTRGLPACWMCGRRCMCSAETAVEYGTCVCCVKALFYHCSSDDEDTCTDKPFSCTQSHCYVRWTTISLLSLLFPCLLCYLPAKCCVTMCQSCYNRVTRPGCRCKKANQVHCEVSKLP